MAWIDTSYKHTVRTTTTTKRFTQTALLLRSLHSENLTGAMDDHGVRAGAAMRRRQRRLRSMLRHERQSIAMALAERLHHSANVTGLKHKEEVEQHAAPRGPKTARAEVEEAVNATHDALRRQNTPPPGLRSPGRREVTAARGTSQGTASQPSACRYWLGRWESRWTPPHSASSQPLHCTRGSWRKRSR